MHVKATNQQAADTTQHLSLLEVVQARPSYSEMAIKVLELTIGTDPSRLLEAAVMNVESAELREFLARVLDEPESRQALTQLIDAGHYAKSPTFVVQLVRRAAEQVKHWCAVGRQERDVLYVATYIQSLEFLLMESLIGNACAQDVIFTIARSALHRLDDQAPRAARLLRLSLGWGNEDEIDSAYVPRLRQSVLKAAKGVSDIINSAGRDEGSPTPAGLPH